DHDRGGRLAMCPRDRHDALSSACDQLPERIGAPHDRQPQRPGALQLRMIPRDRGRNYNSPSPFHVARIVAPPNGNSQRGQVISTCPGSVGITTSYGDSPVPGNQSQGAHPRPGYAHEMDGTGIPGSKQGHLWAANIGNLRDLRKLQYLPDDGSGGVRVTPSSSTFGQGGEPLVVVDERDDGFRERV